MVHDMLLVLVVLMNSIVNINLLTFEEGTSELGTSSEIVPVLCLALLNEALVTGV